MAKFEITTHPEVIQKFNQYPTDVKVKLYNLRELILYVAKVHPDVHQLTESLKWGEPSYLAKKGTPLRIDWKDKTPDHYAIYVQCTSKLIPTFRALYAKELSYEGNRAILFNMTDDLPENILKKFIATALTYHQVKYLDGLGITPI
jgi:hypothetical protein